MENQSTIFTPGIYVVNIDKKNEWGIGQIQSAINNLITINLQRKHTAIRNNHFVDKIEMVLIEKESKRSKDQWAGRTDSNKWVIFNKNSDKIGDIVPVHIASAHGITLQGKIKKLEEMELLTMKLDMQSLVI